APGLQRFARRARSPYVRYLEIRLGLPVYQTTQRGVIFPGAVSINNSMLDFKQIDAFAWVAELGSFRAASEKLNTSQPAISQRIAAMESAMAVRLFERGARGIKLTEKGQELLSHAHRMLALRNEMLTVAKAQNAVRGTLRLG